MTDSIGKQIRRVILEQSKRANVGHIGSALSVADILAALYGGLLRVDDPKDPERDRFVLSKGHAALALYGALHGRDSSASKNSTPTAVTAPCWGCTRNTGCGELTSPRVRSVMGCLWPPAPPWLPDCSNLPATLSPC